MISRAIGLVILVALTIMVVARGLTPASGGLLAFVHLIDLVFHEAGHVIFGLFGRFLGMLGGSLNQVLVPALCTGYFLWHARPAAAAVTLAWAGESLADVAIYVADGRDMALPLLAEGLTHDWNWILSELSLRNQAPMLGRVVLVLAILVMVAAVALLAVDLLRHWSRRAESRVLSSDGPPRNRIMR